MLTPDSSILLTIGPQQEIPKLDSLIFFMGLIIIRTGSGGQKMERDMTCASVDESVI